jgi:hypothetical protein
MTGEELISLLVTDCEQPRDVLRDIFEALATHCAGGLRTGGRVMIPGLGSLRASVRSRMGDPQVRVTWWSEPELLKQLAPLAAGKTGVKAAAKARKRKARAHSAERIEQSV